MKPWLTLLVIVVVAVALPLLSAGKGNAEAGKAIYTKRCATCHGAAGEGKEAIAKMLKVEIKHLGSKEVQSKSDAELHNIIVKGFGKMKPVTGLSEQETTNLIAYVRTLAKK